MEMGKARAPATFAAKQVFVALKLGKELGDLIAPGGGEGGGITLEQALVRLTKASPDLPIAAMERLQTVLACLYRGLSLDDLVTEETPLKGTEGAPLPIDLEGGSVVTKESALTDEARSKANRSKNGMAEVFAAAIARDDSSRDDDAFSTHSSNETTCADFQDDSPFFASRRLSENDNHACNTEELVEERNWLHLSAAERAEALINVAESAERQAAEERAAAASSVEEGLGNGAVADEDGQSPMASAEDGEETRDSMLGGEKEALQAHPDVLVSTVITLGSSLSLLEAELSGDPTFEPVREVASKVFNALRAGRGVEDPLDHCLHPEELSGNEASREAEDSFFEPLAPASSVGEALEYLMRSTQPRQARRAAFALQFLTAGGGFDTPL